MRSKIYISWILMVFFAIPYFFQSFHELQHLRDRNPAHHTCGHHHDHHHDQNPGDNDSNSTLLFEHCLLCDFEFVKFPLPEVQKGQLPFIYYYESIHLPTSTGYNNSDVDLKKLRAPPVKI